MCRSRVAILIALGIVALTAASAWPVYGLGQQAYESVSTTVDPAGQEWLDAHKHRAESLIWTFYALAALAAGGIGVSFRWPKTLMPLAAAVLWARWRCWARVATSPMQAARSGTWNSGRGSPRLKKEPLLFD